MKEKSKRKNERIEKGKGVKREGGKKGQKGRKEKREKRKKKEG